jgi:hypothetical protein
MEDFEARMRYIEEQAAVCSERWLGQSERNGNFTKRVDGMSIRLRSLENWRSNMAGKITVIVAISAFIGSLLAGVAIAIVR